MFTLLKYQLPATAVIPIKMLRYIKSTQYIYDSVDKVISEDQIKDFDEQEFMNMQGKIIFCLNSGEDEQSMKVSITSISLFDLDNKFLVHGLEETLTTNTKEGDNDIILRGKILITNRSILSTGEIKLTIQHSHDNLYEININIYDDQNKELVYGMTLVEQVKEKSEYQEAFSTIK